MKLFLLFASSMALFFSAPQSFAKKGGGSFFGGGDSSIGLGISLNNGTQDDINRAIEASNSAAAPLSTKSMGSAYEFYVQYIYRFSSSIFGLVLRPSYYTNTTTGTGSNGSYDYKLTGYTLIPMLRLVPLENAFISFFLQAGIGYGSLSGEVTEGSNSVSFSGNNFGAQAGLGADFCFTPDHCLTLEGNFRYMPIVRNIASAGSGGTFPGFSQATKDREVENADGNDFQTSLSGIIGLVGYTYKF